MAAAARAGCLVRPGMSQPHGSGRLLQEGRDGAEEEEEEVVGVTHVYCALTSFTISARGVKRGRMARKEETSSSSV